MINTEYYLYKKYSINIIYYKNIRAGESHPTHTQGAFSPVRGVGGVFELRSRQLASAADLPPHQPSSSIRMPRVFVSVTGNSDIRTPSGWPQTHS